MTEAQLLADVDLRTDRTRRSTPSMVGNGLLLIAFIFAPKLPGASSVFGDFDWREGALLSLPALTCVVIGALLYRRLGPNHRAYRALDAVELCTFHAFPAAFPLLDQGTSYIAGGFLLVSAAFWGQGKPGRARLYGALVTALALLAPVVLLVRGESHRATVAAVFGAASVLTYVMAVRARLEQVRAEARRNGLRESLRALRVGRELKRIEQQLTSHVGAQLDLLAYELAQAALPEAHAARRLSKMVSELVFPSAEPVSLNELAGIVFARARALCRGVCLVEHGPTNTESTVDGSSARAVLNIAQELVRNAVMHGRPRTVDVTVDADGGRLNLMVSDDGVGLPAAMYEAATGGLSNARAWLAERAGSITVEPRAGFSTSIVVTL